MSINNNGYTRCHYIGDDGQQCSTWYKLEDGVEDPNHCPSHKGIVSTRLALARGDKVKEEYINQVNQDRVFAAEFRKDNGEYDFDRLDEAIKSVEKVIERERTKLLTYRAVRSDEEQKLSEEEREVRRKYKVPKAAVEEIKKTRVNAMKDPKQALIATLMKSGQDKETAEKNASLIMG